MDLLEGPKSGTLTTPNTNEDIQQQELSFTASGDVKWLSNFRTLLGSFLQNETYFYHMIQKLYSLVFTQRS